MIRNHLFQMKEEFQLLSYSRPSAIRSSIKSRILIFIYSFIIAVAFVLLVYTDPLTDFAGGDPGHTLEPLLRGMLGTVIVFMFLMIRRVRQVLARNEYILNLEIWVEKNLDELIKSQEKVHQS